MCLFATKDQRNSDRIITSNQVSQNRIMNCILYELAKTRERKFSQKEAGILCDFTRKQLQKLEELEILVPQKNPVILYSWNQIIFARTLYCFRQLWSLQDVVKAFRDSENPIDIKAIVENIDKFVEIYLGQKNGIGDPIIYFQVHQAGNLSQIEKKAINKLRDEMSPIVVGNGIAVGQGKFISVNMPKVIEDLEIAVEKLGSK
jgi:hypothetical protein